MHASGMFLAAGPSRLQTTLKFQSSLPPPLHNRLPLPMPGVSRGKRLRSSLDQFLEQPPARFPRTVALARDLQAAMEREGIEQARAGGATPGLLSGHHGRKLRKRLGNLQAKVGILEEELKQHKGKVGGRVAMLWWLRAGLSPANVPLRQVQQFLASCSSLDEQSPLSHSSVAAARDAFAQVLRMLNKADLRVRCKPGLSQKKPVIIQHLHDEASLRLRSYKDTGAKLARGRSSSVQSHSVKVQCGGAQCEFWTEMQALWSKDGSASGLISSCVPSHTTCHDRPDPVTVSVCVTPNFRCFSPEASCNNSRTTSELSCQLPFVSLRLSRRSHLVSPVCSSCASSFPLNLAVQDAQTLTEALLGVTRDVAVGHLHIRDVWPSSISFLVFCRTY